MPLPPEFEGPPPGTLPRARHAVAGAGSRSERSLIEHRVMPPPANRMPDFVGIGAMKAGTTWLFHQLKSHPGIWLSDLKEVHFFDHWRAHPRPLFRYTRRFRPAPKDKLCGEITPGYSTVPPDMVHYMNLLMPRARYFLLMRDPVEQAWSITKFWYMRVRTHHGKPVSEEGMMRFATSNFVRARCDYPTILRNWEWTIPEERLHLDFHDRVAQEPEALLRDVLSFLGASTDVDFSTFPLRQQINKTHETPMPARVRALLNEMFAADLRLLRARFGERVAHWGRGGG